MHASWGRNKYIVFIYGTIIWYTISHGGVRTPNLVNRSFNRLVELSKIFKPLRTHSYGCVSHFVSSESQVVLKKVNRCLGLFKSTTKALTSESLWPVRRRKIRKINRYLNSIPWKLGKKLNTTLTFYLIVEKRKQNTPCMMYCIFIIISKDSVFSCLNFMW